MNDLMDTEVHDVNKDRQRNLANNIRNPDWFRAQSSSYDRQSNLRKQTINNSSLPHHALSASDQSTQRPDKMGIQTF